MSIEEARAILLSFEDAFEASHMGHPDFRIQQGIFASMWPDDGDVVLRLPMDIAEGLASQDPQRIRLVSRYGKMGWIRIKLSTIEDEDFKSLAEMACQARRTKRPR